MVKEKLARLSLFFLYLFISWGAYRFLTDFNEVGDELFFKPLIWLLPVLWLVIKKEKRSLISLGLVFKRPSRKVLLGLGVSLLILAEYLLASWLKGEKIVFNPRQLNWFAWPVFSIVCLSTSLVEETVFRGFFMTRIDELINSQLAANIIAGSLFFMIHLPILVFRQGENLAGLMENFVLFGSLALIDGYIFWRTKGILAPISAHFFLNFFSLLIG